jgi:hypothetical protein
MLPPHETKQTYGRLLLSPNANLYFLVLRRRLGIHPRLPPRMVVQPLQSRLSLRRKETRERDRREKEEAAKRARVEAAEKGRQASREWAEKQKKRAMSGMVAKTASGSGEIQAQTQVGAQAQV